MTSISVNEAQSFSVSEPSHRFHADDAVVDQFFQVLPFEPVEGHSKTISLFDASDVHDHATLVPANSTAVPATLPTLSTRTSRLSHFAARLELDSLIAGHYSSYRDIVMAQLQVKVDAVLAQFQRHLILGNGTNPGEFTGLDLLASGYDVGADNSNANGGIVQRGEVEEAISLLAPGAGTHGRYLVMRSSAYHHLYKHNYTDQIFVLQHEQLGAVPAISGVPILLNDRIPGDQVRGTSNDLTSIYAVVVGKDRGLCGMYPAANEGRHIRIRGPYTKENTDTVHFDVTAQLGMTAYRGPAVAKVSGVAHND